MTVSSAGQLGRDMLIETLDTLDEMYDLVDGLPNNLAGTGISKAEMGAWIFRMQAALERAKAQLADRTDEGRSDDRNKGSPTLATLPVAAQDVGQSLPDSAPAQWPVDKRAGSGSPGQVIGGLRQNHDTTPLE